MCGWSKVERVPAWPAKYGAIPLLYAQQPALYLELLSQNTILVKKQYVLK